MTHAESRERTAKVAELFKAGASCTQLAALFGESRQGIHLRLKKVGVQVGNKRPMLEMFGQKWYQNSGGYYERVIQPEGKHVYLHRVIWEAVNGPIPSGCHIHHKDENPANNALDNLECLTSSAHTSTHMKPARAAAMGKAGRAVNSPAQVAASKRNALK